MHSAPIPGGRRVMLDYVIQRGSGTYMRVQPDANLDSLQSIKSNAHFIKQQHMINEGKENKGGVVIELVLDLHL